MDILQYLIICYIHVCFIEVRLYQAMHDYKKMVTMSYHQLQT